MIQSPECRLISQEIAFENEYNLEIPDEDAEQLDTAGKIKQYIKDYA